MQDGCHFLDHHAVVLSDEVLDGTDVAGAAAPPGCSGAWQVKDAGIGVIGEVVAPEPHCLLAQDVDPMDLSQACPDVDGPVPIVVEESHHKALLSVQVQ